MTAVLPDPPSSHPGAPDAEREPVTRSTRRGRLPARCCTRRSAASSVCWRSSHELGTWPTTPSGDRRDHPARRPRRPRPAPAPRHRARAAVAGTFPQLCPFVRAGHRPRRHRQLDQPGVPRLDHLLRDCRPSRASGPSRRSLPARNAFARACAKGGRRRGRAPSPRRRRDLFPLLSRYLPDGEWAALTRAATTTLSGPRADARPRTQPRGRLRPRPGATARRPLPRRPHRLARIRTARLPRQRRPAAGRACRQPEVRYLPPVSEGPGQFAEQLRRFRERAALSQEELAARAGLTGKAVGALERGERRRPYPHTVRALADALGLDDDEREALTAAARPRRPKPRPRPADPGPRGAADRAGGRAGGGRGARCGRAARGC